MSDMILDAVKESCITAAVSTSAYGVNATDKQASLKTNRDHGAIDGASKTIVNRLKGNDNIHKQLMALQNELTTLLKFYSQPFGNEPKWRLFPNAYFERFVGGASPIVAKHNALRDDVLRAEAPRIIAEMPANLGRFDVPLPTVDELVNSYTLTLDFRPVPESANFRGLDQNTIDKLKEMHDAKLLAAVSIAENSTLERFLEPLEYFVKRMALYDEKVVRDANDPDNKKKDGTFRDSVLDNIHELHDMLGTFNMTGNPKFTQLGNMLDELRGIKPDELRQDDKLRSAATTRAQEIADNLKGWLA